MFGVEAFGDMLLLSLLFMALAYGLIVSAGLAIILRRAGMRLALAVPISVALTAIGGGGWWLAMATRHAGDIEAVAIEIPFSGEARPKGPN